MREKFCISDEVEVRLWIKFLTNTYEPLNKPNTYEPLNKREQTFQEAGLYCGQNVIIETRNKDGSWPRGGTGEG